MPGKTCKRPKVDPTVMGESKTLDTLLQLVGSGGTCIHTAAELARAFQHDAQFEIHEGLKKLASCGNSGLSAQNGERDFRRFTRGAYGFELEPYTIKLTLEVPLTQRRFFILVEVSPSHSPFSFPPCWLDSSTSPSQVPGADDPEECDVSVLLPHEVFGALYASHQAKGDWKRKTNINWHISYIFFPSSQGGLKKINKH